MSSRATVTDVGMYSGTSGVADPTGRVRQEEESGVLRSAYTYDNLYRLIGEDHPDISKAIAYAYDLNGNRTQRTENGVSAFYGVDASDRLLWVNGPHANATNTEPVAGRAEPYTRLSYDTNGRTIRRDRRHTGGLRKVHDFLWDGDDRLRLVKQASSLPNPPETWPHPLANDAFTAAYNGDGLRTSQWDSWRAFARTFTWGPGGVVFDTLNDRVMTPGLAQHRSTGDRFFHGDVQGSTRYTSLGSDGDNFPNGFRYEAYGQKMVRTQGTDWHPTDYLFAGGWGYQNEYGTDTAPGVGLHYLEQRYYDPDTGRFISPDPIGFAGGLNLYRYCGNDPVNGADPSGLMSPEEAQNLDPAYRSIYQVQGAIWETGRPAAGPGYFDHFANQPDVASAILGGTLMSGAGVGSGGSIVQRVVSWFRGPTGASPTPQVQGCVGGVAPAAPAGRHLVYELVNRTTNQVDYVGITTNATLRWFVHRLRFRNHRMVEISGMSGLAKVEARGVEQVLIEYYGRRGIDTGGQLYNKYNSIALKKPYYGPATRAGLGRLYREGYQF